MNPVAVVRPKTVTRQRIPSILPIRTVTAVCGIVGKVNITRRAYQTNTKVKLGVFANVREILNLNCYFTACIRGYPQEITIVTVVTHDRATADVGRIVRYVRRNNVYPFYRLSKYRFIARNHPCQGVQFRIVRYVRFFLVRQCVVGVSRLLDTGNEHEVIGHCYAVGKRRNHFHHSIRSRKKNVRLIFRLFKIRRGFYTAFYRQIQRGKIVRLRSLYNGIVFFRVFNDYGELVRAIPALARFHVLRIQIVA